MNSPWHSLPGAFWKRIAPLAIIYLVVTVVYGNLAVILNESPLKTHLPVVSMHLDLFNLFAVFSYYEAENMEVVLQGHETLGSGCTCPPRWITLNPDEYFPYWKGEQQMRMWASRQYGDGGSTAQRNALATMARKIRARYNREHPACHINQVNIAAVTWPRSKKGYSALKVPGKTHFKYWYQEKEGQS